MSIGRRPQGGKEKKHKLLQENMGQQVEALKEETQKSLKEIQFYQKYLSCKPLILSYHVSTSFINQFSNSFDVYCF